MPDDIASMLAELDAPPDDPNSIANMLSELDAPAAPPPGRQNELAREVAAEGETIIPLQIKALFQAFTDADVSLGQAITQQTLASPKFRALILPPAERAEFLEALKRQPGPDRGIIGKTFQRFMRGGRRIEENLVAFITDFAGLADDKTQEIMSFGKEIEAARRTADPASATNVVGRGLLGAAEAVPALATGAALAVPGGAVAGVVSATSFWFTQIAPEAFDEFRAEGFEEGPARTAAAITAAAEAAIEMIQKPLDTVLPKPLRTGTLKKASSSVRQYIRGAMKEWLKGGAKEFSEEIFQDFTRSATKAGLDVLDDDVSVDIKKELGDKFSLDRLAETAVTVFALQSPGPLAVGVRDIREIRSRPANASRKAFKDAGLAVGKDEEFSSIADREQHLTQGETDGTIEVESPLAKFVDASGRNNQELDVIRNTIKQLSNEELQKARQWSMEHDSPFVRRVFAAEIREENQDRSIAKLVEQNKQGETDGTARTQPERAQEDTVSPETKAEAQAPAAPEAAAQAGQEIEQPPVTTQPETAQPEQPNATSIKNAVVDQEREARGLPPAMQPAKRAFGTVWQEAMDIIESDPGRQDALIDELTKKPRGLKDDTESALLLHRQIALQTAHTKALDVLEQAQIEGDNEVISDKESHAEVLLQELEKLYDIEKKVGTTAGRVLNIRKMLAREDFSLVRLLRNARKAKGVNQLSAEEQAQVQEQARQVARLEQQHTEAAAGKDDAKTERLRFELEQLKVDILKGNLKDQRGTRTGVEKVLGSVGESQNLIRAIWTGFEFSGFGRQGRFFLLGHPVKAFKNIPNMLRAASNKARFSRIMNEIRNDPVVKSGFAARSGLDFLELDALDPLQAEEDFVSTIAGKIPLLRGSQRAFVAVVNLIKLQMFKTMISTGKGGTVSEANGKLIANYVNIATGRGPLGPLKRSARGVSQILFSPRWQASRFQLLFGQPFFKSLITKGDTKQARNAIANEYARALAGASFYTATLSAALFARFGPPGEDKEWDIEHAPFSAGFLKIRIGDTFISPLAGLTQITVFLSREFGGRVKSRSTGETVPIRGSDVPFGGTTIADVAFRFGRGKLAPLPAIGWDLLTGEDFVGDPATLKSVAMKLPIPITYQNIFETMKDQGIAGGTALTIMEVFGETIQTFPKFKAGSLIRKIGDAPQRTGTKKATEYNANIDEWVQRLKKFDLPDSELIAQYEAILQKKHPKENEARKRLNKMAAFKRQMGIQ